MNTTSYFITVLVFSLVFVALMWRRTHGKCKNALRETEKLKEKIEHERVKLRNTLEKTENLQRELNQERIDHAKAAERVSEFTSKYLAIVSQEDEISRLKQEAEDLSKDISSIRATYSEKRKLLDQLREQIAIFDDRIALAELGVYEPHFDYDASEEFKKRICEVREKQKAMVSSFSAIRCPLNVTVEGSKSKGKTMIYRQTRLTLRAFNNECDAAFANVRWNNVVAMERRILNSEKVINKDNSSLNMIIDPVYVALKIEELRLTHEYRERLKFEKRERAELARAEKEEVRLIAESEAAEREELKYQKLLEKARRELGGEMVNEEMRRKVAELEVALKNAHEVSVRARAMAEMTKSGYVYVISNIGSFGEDVIKIGLTRRLDPDDRVRELGDASVPFAFDTHAMIYSDDAPALEAALHKKFANRRINMTNTRKEFFRVALDEVELAVAELAPSATFFKDREAQEWYETLARRNELLSTIGNDVDDLPIEI